MKRFFVEITTLACAGAMLAATLTGCGGDTHEHEVSVWNTVVEATCVTEGIEEGTCVDCLQKVTRNIGTDPDNHTYGDWVITTTPTESRSGYAEKTCEDCGYVLSIRLPSLSNMDEYKSEITVKPTANTDGVRTYTYAHEEGDVVFDVAISSSGITSVLDAVELGSSDESHALIRRGEGTIGFKYYEYGNTPSTEAGGTYYPYSYEYGDNYTHIDDIDYDKFERWYAKDSDGEIYGYAWYNPNASGRSDFYNGGSFYEETLTDTDGECKNYFYGYRFSLLYTTRTGGVTLYYGTENLLAGLYSVARNNDNGDFEYSIDTSSGETVYSFSFGAYSLVGNGGGYYAQVEVEFTLTDEYTIKTLTAESTVYVNDGTEDNTWEINDEGYARLIKGQEMGKRYFDHIYVEQTTIAEAEAAGEEVPTNPYDKEKMTVTDIEITYNGNVLEDGDTVSVTASEQVSFTIAVTPDDLAVDVTDKFTFYYRSFYADGTPLDTEINFESLSSVGVNAILSSDGKTLRIRSNIAGSITVVIKADNVERVINLEVGSIAPTELNSYVYQYYTGGTYTWMNYSTTTISAGQTLYFYGRVPAGEVNYADSNYTVAVQTDNSSSDYTLVQSVTYGGVSCSSFKPTKAGTYVLTITAAKDSEVTCTITVTVTEGVSADDIFGYDYKTYTSFNYPMGSATVTFELSGGYYYATITYRGSTEVLLCIYNQNDYTLQSTHFSGEELGFELSFNGVELVLTHPATEIDGLDLEFDESVTLTKQTT